MTKFSYRYQNKAKKISQIFRDQPIQALDKAVYWTEYILRHNGAPFLQSEARNLNWFQYHSFDVIASLLAIVFIGLYMTKVAVCYVCSCCRKTEGNFTSLEKKKRN